MFKEFAFVDDIQMAGYINSKRAPHYFVKEQDRYLFLKKGGIHYVCATFGIKLSRLTNRTIYFVLYNNHALLLLPLSIRNAHN